MAAEDYINFDFDYHDPFDDPEPDQCEYFTITRIVHETPKATLFEIDGKQYWIPKSVYSIDGSEIWFPSWFNLKEVGD